MHSVRVAVVALSTVASFAAVGCGGQESSSKGASGRSTAVVPHSSPPASVPPPSGRPLTRAELIAQGDAICRRVNLKRSTIRLETSRDYAQLLPFAAYQRTALAQMRNLIPPASMATNWSKILADTQTVAEAMAGVGAAGLANQAAELSSQARRGGKALYEAQAIAKREGFKDCARLKSAGS